jgi:hypothetical protein
MTEGFLCGQLAKCSKVYDDRNFSTAFNITTPFFKGINNIEELLVVSGQWRSLYGRL